MDGLGCLGYVVPFDGNVEGNSVCDEGNVSDWGGRV